MINFLYIVTLAICISIGLFSFISGIKGKNKILWLSINSENQKHYEKYASIYNIVFGTVLVLACGYVLVTKLF
jgi:hypothetical protein